MAKVSEGTLNVWLRILLRVPNAVLWLVRIAMTPPMELRLQQRFDEAGLERRRLVITDAETLEQHIATKRVASLHLDTPVYNGHMTAADVYWAGGLPNPNRSISAT